jgi:hypothetical protein
MKRHALATFLFSAVLVSSCTPRPPVPELVAMAYTPSASPKTLTGEPLQACINESGIGRSGKDLVDGEAVYNPSMTYAFAERFHAGPSPLAPYAVRVRAYTLGSKGTDVFERSIHDDVVCYYEFKDGNFRILTSLEPDAEGRASVVQVNDAVLKAYAIMAGKNVTTVRLLGPYVR